MAEIKKTGGNAGPVQPPVAAAVTEARAAQKTAQLEAGQALIAETAKQVARARQELEREQAEKRSEQSAERDRYNEKRDTSELSEQSRWFGTEGKLLEDADIKWTLEMMQELWEAFQQWKPQEGEALSARLEDLAKLYLALLEAILTHTMGDGQITEAGRLNLILAEKLNLLLETDLKDLKELLEKTGQTDTLDLVKASVYKQATGESVSGRTAARFYAQGNAVSFRSNRYFMPETPGQGTGNGQRAAGMSGAEEGRIYKPAGGRSVQMSQEFDAQRKSGGLEPGQRGKLPGGLGQGGMTGAGASGGKAVFNSSELTRAELLASHLNGSGNLLRNAGISAENDEVRGLLAAITNIKGQVYAAAAGRDNGLVTPLRNAINQMVDYYLSQKGMYKTYYYTTGVYERTGNPQKAVEEGLEYACRLFMEKKADGTCRGQAAYSWEAGFFQMFLKGQTLQEDLAKGRKILEENWREFLRAAGESDKKRIVLRMQKHSPWGMLEEPEETGKSGRKKKDSLILAEIIGTAVIVVIYICYRIFFG